MFHFEKEHCYNILFPASLWICAKFQVYSSSDTLIVYQLVFEYLTYLSKNFIIIKNSCGIKMFFRKHAMFLKFELQVV